MESILERCKYHGQETSFRYLKHSNIGSSLSTYKILYQCDNTSVVIGICYGSARDIIVMHLLRSLSWFSLPTMIIIDLVCEHNYSRGG